MIRVLLVDDDARIRRGWEMRLGLEPDIEVVGTAEDMTTAVLQAIATPPHIILLDIKLSGMDGLTGIAHLRRAAPDSAIIIVTVYDSTANQQKALAAGASAFVSKQTNFDKLLAFIRQFGSQDTDSDIIPKIALYEVSRNKMGIRVLLVDDHSVVRQGLRMFLGLDPELTIVGEAVNGVDAIQKAHDLQPDVILMDLMMPVMDGMTAIGVLRRELPEIEIIALTSVLEDASVFNAMRAGATGYLLKDTEADELCRAIKAAAAGQVQLSPQAAARLLREVPAPDSPEHLTDRETDVLRLLAQGLANKEIAAELIIGEKTVKTHVSNILGKLGVVSRTQAALYATRIGLV
jgi:DNA-binding NarL/FixJ family response regulator